MDGSLFVSAGEVSGDHYIARVFEELRSSGYSGRVCGLCGDESRRAGVEALWMSERLQIMGFSEILAAIGDILKLMGEIFRSVMSLRPGVMLLADSPDFHLPLIRKLRRGGYRGKIFYISPPSVWAWRAYRVRTLRRHVDMCLPLFRFERDFLQKHDVDSLWSGHPLVEEFAGEPLDEMDIASRVVCPSGAIDPDRVVALLPGSRRMEVEQLYPILSEVAENLAGRGYSPVFSVAPGLSDGAKNYLLPKLASSGQNYFEGRGRELMALSKVVAGSSGTATAEALLLSRYMVVLYKLRPLSAIIGKILLSHIFFAIPNLLANEMFFPELLQERATGANATAELLGWLEMDDEKRGAKEARMRELAASMGRPGVYDFWAGRVLEAL
ncbi:MAG: lipid-A-disaccharide synthase [Synergistaceae bacterium]|jgi:lipid-A-disaccharide synthase|nr:lipid-A-disaccharide synthase [Synergistaceae bacterium]